MAKRVYSSDLSVDGVQSLIKEVEKYRDSILPNLLKTFVERLSTKGVDVAKANIVKYNAIMDGNLINSINIRQGVSDKTTVAFYVVANSEEAAFVEFGTGQMGKLMPYPYPLPPNTSWEYNVGPQIHEFAPGQWGWVYYKNGQYWFTQGMPSRPFMYETSVELMMEVVKIAKEVFA